MNLSLASLTIMSLFLAAICLAGATLYSSAASNCLANGCTYSGATAAYPLINQSNSFTASAQNFSSTFMNATQSSTTTPVASNPLTLLFNGAPAIIGLVWGMMGLVQAMIGTGLGAAGGVGVAGFSILPVWAPILAVIGVTLFFVFAALQYVLRWFG